MPLAISPRLTHCKTNTAGAPRLLTPKLATDLETLLSDVIKDPKTSTSPNDAPTAYDRKHFLHLSNWGHTDSQSPLRLTVSLNDGDFGSTFSTETLWTFTCHVPCGPTSRALPGWRNTSKASCVECETSLDPLPRPPFTNLPGDDYLEAQWPVVPNPHCCRVCWFGKRQTGDTAQTFRQTKNHFPQDASAWTFMCAGPLRIFFFFFLNSRISTLGGSKSPSVSVGVPVALARSPPCDPMHQLLLTSDHT